MTIQESINALSQHNMLVLGYLVLLPALTFLVTLLYRPSPGRLTAVDAILSVFVYLACIPGTLALTLLFYQFFFTKTNLLNVNALVYIGSPATMAAVLMILARKVNFDDLPGFDRLNGLMILIAMSGAGVLFVHKTRILVGFFGSVQYLLILGVVFFLVMRFALKRAMGNKANS